MNFFLSLSSKPLYILLLSVLRSLFLHMENLTYSAPLLITPNFKFLIETTLIKLSHSFNFHGSVHRNNILIYIQQDATLRSLFYLQTAVHVSGGTITNHQERKQLYLHHLVFVTLLLLSACSNSSTIAADSNNDVTNTRCCRYSCLRS